MTGAKCYLICLNAPGVWTNQGVPGKFGVAQHELRVAIGDSHPCVPRVVPERCQALSVYRHLDNFDDSLPNRACPPPFPLPQHLSNIFGRIEFDIVPVLEFFNRFTRPDFIGVIFQRLFIPYRKHGKFRGVVFLDYLKACHFLPPVNFFPVPYVYDLDSQGIVNNSIDTSIIAKTKPKIIAVFKLFCKRYPPVRVLRYNINFRPKQIHAFLGKLLKSFYGILFKNNFVHDLTLTIKSINVKDNQTD